MYNYGVNANSVSEKMKRLLTRTGERGVDFAKDKLTDNVKSYINNELKNHFGFETVITENKDVYKAFLKWLKEHDKNYNKHVSTHLGEERIINTEFIIKVSDWTFMYVCTGNIRVKRSNINELLANTNGDQISKNDLYVYICGKKSYHIYKELEKILNINKDVLTVFKIMKGYSSDQENFRAVASDARSRRFNTIFLENKVIDKIKDHIDKFIDNQPVYKSRDLLYKTGILLEGEPGTGKTSLAGAIATEYDCDLIIIDMNEFSNINATMLADTINADNEMYVVLLEDIDCVIGDREDENIDKEEKSAINKLLQFLDSQSSPTNCIFIATTNHPEKLDSAIKRDGRFDLIVDVRGIKEKKAREMCKSFGLEDDKIDKLFIENDITFEQPINQSKLQNLILKSFERKNVNIVAGDENDIINTPVIAEEEKDKLLNDYDPNEKVWAFTLSQKIGEENAVECSFTEEAFLNAIDELRDSEHFNILSAVTDSSNENKISILGQVMRNQKLLNYNMISVRVTDEFLPLLQSIDCKDSEMVIDVNYSGYGTDLVENNGTKKVFKKIHINGFSINKKRIEEKVKLLEAIGESNEKNL